MKVERSSLLHQLRIDRDPSPVRHSRHRWFWWLLGACVLMIGAAAAVWMRSGVPVRAAVAQPVPKDDPAARGALLNASGYVVAKRQATVSAKVTGRLMQSLIEEGQRVEANQVIAKIDDSNALAGLAQAKAGVERAKAGVAAAKVAADNALPTYRRNREQVAEGLISAEAFEGAKANYDGLHSKLEIAQQELAVAQANLLSAQRTEDDYTVRAPFSGVITAKNALPGEIVSPLATGGFTRTGIATLVDMESLEVEVDVSENFINRIRPGQAAVATLNAYPDWHIRAAVIAVIPSAEQAKATVRVRVGFKEKDPRLLPQMGVRVAFLDDAPQAAADGPPGVIVPADAVRASGATGVVFEIRGNTVRQRAVALGARTANGQTVRSGLEAGERVAIGNLAKLSDGARVRVEK